MKEDKERKCVLAWREGDIREKIDLSSRTLIMWNKDRTVRFFLGKEPSEK